MPTELSASSPVFPARSRRFLFAFLSTMFVTTFEADMNDEAAKNMYFYLLPSRWDLGYPRPNPALTCRAIICRPLRDLRVCHTERNIGFCTCALRHDLGRPRVNRDRTFIPRQSPIRDGKIMARQFIAGLAPTRGKSLSGRQNRTRQPLFEALS